MSRGQASGQLPRLQGADASPVQVECYSGHTYAQDPRAVVGPQGRVEVAAVLRRWREPEGPAFRVRLSDGAMKTLVYHEATDRWFVREDTE